MKPHTFKIKEVVILAAFSRLLIFLIATSGYVIMDHQVAFQAPNINVPFFGFFARWDSFYYIDIATHGYSFKTDLWAFRPLYPLILWLLGSPFTWYMDEWSSFLIAGLIWNMFAFFLAVIYLYKLTAMLINEKIAYTTILLLSFFPGSLFFTAIYAESTYLFLVAASFYYLEIGKNFHALMLAVLASFTRPEGFLIFVPFLLKASNLKGNKRVKLFVFSSLIICTLPVFMLYCYFLTGDPYIPLKVEAQWPKTTLYDLLVNAYRGELMNEGVDRLSAYLISTIILTIAIISILKLLSNFKSLGGSAKTKLMHVWRYEKMPYYVWAILLFASLIFQGGYAGLPRFASTLFPIFWGNALWINKSPFRAYLLFSLYTCLLALGTTLFVNWYYFL
jgi:hypothetical protein